MIAGFTGTRKGISHYQCGQLMHQFIELGITKLLHGGCRGGDAQAYLIAKALGIETERYPSNIPRTQFVGIDDVVHPAKPPLERNHDIVDAVEILFVGPRTNQEEVRSGTWATWRYAMHIDTPIIILSRVAP